MVIKNVEAPEPSKCATMAITTVPIQILTGSPLTSVNTREISGSNKPALFITPKNKMANPSMIPVGATPTMPSSIKPPSSAPKPPIKAKTTGTRINATMTDTLLVSMSAKNTKIVKNPSNANTFLLLVNVNLFHVISRPAHLSIGDSLASALLEISRVQEASKGTDERFDRKLYPFWAHISVLWQAVTRKMGGAIHQTK